ncbi:MAG: RNA polymerase sigma factor [Blautia sp.]|nr:RNA polymerase sigma factor [Blautia sp.]
MADFEEIYKTYFNDVFLYIRRLSNDAHIAEEITSETFFKAMRDIDRFRGECHIRVWLCQIAKNCYYSYLKKAKRTDSLPDAGVPDVPDPGEGFEEKLIRHDEAGRIRKILHSIQEPYREVFMWRVFADLSFKDIGQIFHKSENWACVTYHRARGMIKERLEAQEHEK